MFLRDLIGPHEGIKLLVNPAKVLLSTRGDHKTLKEGGREKDSENNTLEGV